MQVWLAMEMSWNSEPHVISVHRTEEGANRKASEVPKETHSWVNGPFEVED